MLCIKYANNKIGSFKTNHTIIKSSPERSVGPGEGFPWGFYCRKGGLEVLRGFMEKREIAELRGVPIPMGVKNDVV